ncbi:MAG TPA: acyltransferase family protein [Kiritimatiellia bacterium]|nr:acyltransferase family protein [Kiritimatiellia bacterium]HMO99325.1 acyltransferase family protein [Kiritimatiellia bacterium]HMP96083.1 acyltransferase family protein [Kiritimatiellia bacterium]
MKRTGYIDVARGISIVLVVMGHESGYFGSIPSASFHSMVSSTRLPLFFFLSGLFLMGDTSSCTHLRKRTKTILLPYLITLTAVWFLGKMWPLSANYDLVAIAYGAGNLLGWPWSPCWFLPHLWLASVLTHPAANTGVFRSASQLRRYVYCAAIAGAGVIVMGIRWTDVIPGFYFFTRNGLPLGLDLVLFTSAYMLLGAGLKARVLSLEPNIRLLMATAFICMVVISLFPGGGLDLNQRTILMPAATLALSLAGIYWVLGLAWLIDHEWSWAAEGARLIGQNSLYILMFHGYVYDSMMLSMDGMSYVYQKALASTSCILIPTGAGYVGKRMASWVHSG